MSATCVVHLAGLSFWKNWRSTFCQKPKLHLFWITLCRFGSASASAGFHRTKTSTVLHYTCAQIGSWIVRTFPQMRRLKKKKQFTYFSEQSYDYDSRRLESVKRPILWKRPERSDDSCDSAGLKTSDEVKTWFMGCAAAPKWRIEVVRKGTCDDLRQKVKTLTVRNGLI